MFYKLNQRLIILFFLIILSFSTEKIGAQTISPLQIENTSSDEMNSLLKQARSKGYSIAQMKALAVAKGLSSSQISALENKFSETTDSNDRNEDIEIDRSLSIVKPPINGFSDTVAKGDVKKDLLFGFDFFNNQNISFQPNINLATPANYQLGPGDAIVVSLWGAAENTYTLEVNKNGALKLPNVGPVVVNGMTFEKASEKIENKLQKIYAGIAAPDSSPYKVFTDITLSSIRTVQVNIIGEVKVPGTYSLSALSTVLNALYACGGPTKNGTFRDVKLVRRGEIVSHFDVYKYLIEGSQNGNNTLQDQDILIVDSYKSRITIRGAVKRPGDYEIKTNENLQDLLKYVSGFNSKAYRDNIKIERIDGDRKKIKEIDYKSFITSKLFDGDVITVDNIIDKIENRISILGSVYRPGDYEFTAGLSISQLINKASGLTDNAYLKRGLVTRTENGTSRNMTSFSIEEVLKGTNEIKLQPNDVVQIFSDEVVIREGTISISGAVKVPTSIPFVENITLEDLVIIANGYKKEAETNVIDVTRKAIDDDYSTINETFKISSNGSLDVRNNTPFVFQPNDKVIVRYLKGVTDDLSAVIEGEVNYPGRYFMTIKNERILDLINKAGGLSPYAYEEGATLIRKNPFYKGVGQKFTSKDVRNGMDTLDIATDLNNKKSFRLGIDLIKLLKDGEQSKHNLILQNGDKLLIPALKETVKVEGEVFLPSLIRYDKGVNLKSYIDKSGGFLNKAKRGKIYVIYPNGDVAATKNFLFLRTYPKILPGSLIIIPARPIRSKISTQEVIGISAGLGTLALLVERLFSN